MASTPGSAGVQYCRTKSREVVVVRNGKFVIKQGRGGKTHFVLLASNGRVVVTSETYESKQSCLKGIEAVKRLAADAAVTEDGATSAPTAPKRAAAGKPAAASK
jgi:uncharacterized protein YegP (UPF0339 family)